jgi:hypothetical protein
MGVMQLGRRGFLALLAMAWLGLAGHGQAATPLRVERLQIVAASGPVAFQVEIADRSASTRGVWVLLPTLRWTAMPKPWPPCWPESTKSMTAA